MDVATARPKTAREGFSVICDDDLSVISPRPSTSSPRSLFGGKGIDAEIVSCVPSSYDSDRSLSPQLPVHNFPLAPSPATLYSDQKLPEEVISNLRELRRQGTMCDFEIEIDGTVLQAHRIVLAAASPYFHGMFTYDSLEAQTGRVMMSDVTPLAMRLLIDYIYSTEISINSENVQQLLFAATVLQLDRVCSACQEFLTKCLTTSNCLTMRKFAEHFSCRTLITNTDDFAAENFRELRHLPEFQTITTFCQLHSIIRRDDLMVNSEEEVYETVIDWVKVDPEARAKDLPRLLQSVSLSELPCGYLLNIVKEEPLIKKNPVCQELLSDAIVYHLRGFVNNETEAKSVEGCQAWEYYPEVRHPMERCRPRKNLAGVIFCVGGRGTAGDPFKSVEAYDLRRDRWFAVPEMKSQRRHVGVVSAQGKLYAIGGHDGEDHLNTAECFDPATNQWTKVAPMSTARRGIAVGSMSGVIYAVGGLDDSTCFNVVERYDVESNAWTTVSPMFIRRGGVAVATLGKCLYAVGGNDGTASLDSCEAYNPLVDRWQMVAPMLFRRAGAGVCVLNGYLYAIGGFDDNAPLDTVERYEPETKSWKQLAPMSCPRGGVGVAAMAGLVYAIGGHDGQNYLDSVEAYNPALDQWTRVSGIRECRAGAGVGWADCRVELLQQPRNVTEGTGSTGRDL
ncbi:unnamed protein product, partial [Mesorhabditis spiculigera]